MKLEVHNGELRFLPETKAEEIINESIVDNNYSKNFIITKSRTISIEAID